MTYCSIKNCYKPIKTKKLCKAHYLKKLKYRNPLYTPKKKPPAAILMGDFAYIRTFKPPYFYAKVDIEMAHFSERRWYISSAGYFVCFDRKETHFMHHLVLGKPAYRRVVDHINRVKTDNRGANLRLTTFSVNSRNSKVSTRNTSGTKGVSYIKKEKSWRAYIDLKGRTQHLGTYKDKNQAIAARMAADIVYEILTDVK